MKQTKAQQQPAGEDQAYLSPSAPVATGKAPGMKARLLSENAGVKNYVIVLAKGDEVMSGLTDFARQNKVTSAGFNAIGAFSHATVAWFDDSKKEFKLNPINQQVELVSMIGNITLNDQPAVHTHVAVASSDGSAGWSRDQHICVSNPGGVHDRLSDAVTQRTGCGGWT